MASFMPQRRPTTLPDRFTAPSLEHAARTVIPEPDADAILRDQPTPAPHDLATRHRPLTPIPLFRPDTSAPRFPVPQLKQASVATVEPSPLSASAEVASGDTEFGEAQEMVRDAATKDAGRACVAIKQIGSGVAPIPPDGGNPPPVQRKNVTGLPDALKAAIEALSGIALDDVRVRYNSPKAAQIGALAYAQGADIHVGPGQERHLPHEAWHVVQQKQRRVRATVMAKGLPINDDHILERETDAMGERAIRSLAGTATQARKWANAPGTPVVQWRTRRTVKGSPNPGPGEALVGSSRSQMRNAAVKRIASDSNHPLRFLLGKKGKFKKQSGLSHAELADRPDLIQMGHIQSNKTGGTERLMLQGAWENQFNNVTVESPHVGGAVLDQPAIEIGGIAVDLKTAQFWEQYGFLKPGTVDAAPKIMP